MGWGGGCGGCGGYIVVVGGLGCIRVVLVLYWSGGGVWL